MPRNATSHTTGNIYAFKIAANSYAFARLVFSIPSSIYLMEILNHISNTANLPSNTALPPVLMPFECVYPKVVSGKPWNWIIVSRDQNFTPPDRKLLEELELVTGICEVSKFDPDWTENCGRMLWKSKRRIAMDEYQELDKSSLSMNRALNPQLLIADLRRHWSLRPFDWPNTKAMIADLIQEGVYESR